MCKSVTFLFSRLFTFLALCDVIGISNAQLTIPVLSVNETYPVHSTDNKTQFSNIGCQCTPGTEITAWSKWSTCGGSNRRSFRCHSGLTFKEQSCQMSLLVGESCVHRVWRYCYHEASCNGNWVEWIDKRDAARCSRSCGGGVRIRIKLCMVDGEVGLFCGGTQRKPYDIIYEVCNNHSCQDASIPPMTSTRIPPKTSSGTNEPRSSGNQAGLYGFNTLTWLFVAISAVLVIVVCILSVCLIVACTQKKRATRNRFKPIPQHLTTQPNGSPRTPDYQHLQRPAATNIALDTPTSSLTRPDRNHINTSSIARTHNATPKQDTSSTPRHKSKPRSLAPIPPPVLNKSFTDLSNEVMVTSDVASLGSNVEAASYTGTNYLQSIPRFQGAKFRVGDDDSNCGTTSQVHDENVFEMGEFRSDDDSHLYAEIPK